MGSTTHVVYDRTRPLAEQPGVGHNRWHPDIPPVARIEPGETITLECADGTDMQVHRDSTRADLAAQESGRVHPLTGPVYVEGAEPGDVLEIEIVHIEPSDWGFTCVLPGFGFLPDAFPDPYLAIWEIDGSHARTDVLPGIAIPACKHPGIVGLAPSHAELKAIKQREDDLAARGGARVPDDPATAFPPECANGLRTIPPRELGGNLDIRELGEGSRLLLPVSVDGALFSVGDVHFAQGNGEVCGTAIEMSAAVTVRIALQKQPGWRPRTPAYSTPAKARRAYFATTGIPVDGDRNESMDISLAARNALLELIGWLVATRGYSREAAYVLCSAAVDLSLNQVVDRPNPLVSALIPLDVFEDPRARAS